jgi:hypothetical protein
MFLRPVILFDVEMLGAFSQAWIFCDLDARLGIAMQCDTAASI